MSRYLIPFFVFLLFSCNDAGKPLKSNGCKLPMDNKAIFEIARNIIANREDYEGVIWNISEIDTTDLFIAEDYFTDTKVKSRLVLVSGFTGGSSGTADNLLILLACTDTVHVTWAGQMGEITQADIKDLDGDGIAEIVCRSSVMWMGECHESYTIFNFKGGKMHELYDAQSFSYVDCGRENINEIHQPGDTLSVAYTCSLVPAVGKRYHVQQICTAKLHNGGSNDSLVIANLKVYTDTALVVLK